MISELMDPSLGCVATIKTLPPQRLCLRAAWEFDPGLDANHTGC